MHRQTNCKNPFSVIETRFSQSIEKINFTTSKMRVQLWKFNYQEAREDFELFEQDQKIYVRDNLQRPVFTFWKEVELAFSEEEIAGFVFISNMLLEMLVNKYYNRRKKELKHFDIKELETKLIGVSPIGREPTRSWNFGNGDTGFYLVDRMFGSSVSEENYQEYLDIIDKANYAGILNLSDPEEKQNFKELTHRLHQIRSLPRLPKVKYELGIGDDVGFFKTPDFIRGIKSYYEYTGIHSDYYGDPMNFSFSVNGELYKKIPPPKIVGIDYDEEPSDSE